MKDNANSSLKDWIKIYQDAIHNIGYSECPAQLEVIAEFARIEADLKARQNQTPTNNGLLSRWFNKNEPAPTLVKGLYCYGGVGRGKTFLMDLFQQNVEFSALRMHFHHFMKEIHARKNKIKQQDNPLTLIANDFAKDYQLICLDEFFVSDITDAMILYGLLKAFKDNGLVIVTTTNIEPDNLYKDGLQRARFIPAIEMIKADFKVLKIADGEDFRLRDNNLTERFVSPIDATTNAKLVKLAEYLAGEHLYNDDGVIEINHREIHYLARSRQVIWFDFNTLCNTARSTHDYIALAAQFEIIIVSNIPLLDEYHENAAKRFLFLIDELYDQRTILLLSSEVPAEEIYQGKRMTFEFERLKSRLHDMQREDYINESHLKKPQRNNGTE